MRYSFVGLLLLALNSTVLAQTTVPFTFTSGTAAKASEVNADFQALATAIDNLTARVSKLEGQFTAADVAGTYAFMSLEVEIGTGLVSMIHHASGNGSVTLNANGAFSFNATDHSSHLALNFSVVKGGTGGTVTDATLTANTTTASTPQNDSGTWSLSGKTLTLIFSSGQSVAFIGATGPSLFMNAINTPDGRDQSLVFLIRTN